MLRPWGIWLVRRSRNCVSDIISLLFYISGMFECQSVSLLSGMGWTRLFNRTRNHYPNTNHVDSCNRRSEERKKWSRHENGEERNTLRFVKTWFSNTLKYWKLKYKIFNSITIFRYNNIQQDYLQLKTTLLIDYQAVKQLSI